MTAIDMITHTGSWLEDRTHYNADDAIGRALRGTTMFIAAVSGVAVAILFETHIGNLFS